MTRTNQSSTTMGFFIKLVSLWLLLGFLPLWLLLSCSSSGKRFVLWILQFSKLDSDIQILRNTTTYIKNWVLGVIRAILSRSPKSKYPFGYAMLKKNGMYINTDSQYPYVIQLYDYLSRKFMYLKNLSTYRVMEIQPTTEGGLDYLATSLKATSCLGVTTDQTSFRSLKKANINPRVKYLCSPTLDSSQIKDSNYDVVIGINIFQKSTLVDETMKLIRMSLKPTGYACIVEYLPIQQISLFQYWLKESGLRIVKTQNLSSSLSNAIKIQAKQQTAQSFLQKIKRTLGYLLQQDNIHIDILAQLQMRRKFIAYILETEAA